MKRGLKIFCTSLLVLFMGLVISITLVLFKPSILINGHTLKLVASRLRSSGVEVDWEGLADIHVDSISFSKKSFVFDFKKPCIKTKDVNGCFDRVAFTFNLDFASLPIQVDAVGPLIVTGGKLDAQTSTTEESSEKSKPKKKVRHWDRWISFKNVKLESVLISLEQIKVNDFEGYFHFASDNKPGEWSGNLTLNRLNDFREINADFRLKNTQANALGKWTLALSSDAQTSQGHLGVEATFLQMGSELSNFDYRARGFLNGPKHVVADVSGHYRPGHITGNIQGAFNPEERRKLIAGPISRARINHCSVDLKERENGAERDLFSGNASLDCVVLADLELPNVKSIPKLTLPKSTELHVVADLKTTYPFSVSDPTDGRVMVELKSIQYPLITGDGKISALISGVPEKFPENWKVDSELGVRLLIPSFAKAAVLLKDTSFAVPAPLDAMDGSVEVSANGMAGLNGGTIPVFIKTRLASRFQKLNIDGGGTFDFTKSAKGFQEKVSVTATLSDAVLAFPRLSLEQPPRLLPDSRIHRPRVSSLGAAADEESSFHYQIHFVTPDEHPLIILSNLAQASVPISVDLTLGDQVPMTGFLRVSKFPLQLFKRNAELVKFNLNFLPEAGNHPVEGSIRVTYTDYIIRIRVYGTSEKPQVAMTSEPPLSETQVIAVLLFGRTLDQLDTTQGESVGNAQAAVADGAIGLASLYVLASTPVESIGYDPSTGVVSAKVRLAEGTSLNLGGGSEQKFVGVRKRLSRFWTIDTELANRTGTESTTLGGLTALLEWSHRY